MNLIDLFFKRVAELKDDIAYYYLVDGEDNVETITYGELERKASLVASFLQSKYEPQSRIVLLFDTSLDFIISFWGCVLAQMVAVPVQPPFNFKMLERLILIGKNANSNVLITTNDFLKHMDMFKEYLTELPEMEKFAVNDILNMESTYKKPSEIDKNHHVVIQYTSGSVGNSKGVVLTHENIFHNTTMPMAVLAKIKPETTEKDSCMTWLPIYHDMGLVSGVILPVAIGTYSAVMSPLMFLQKPLRWIKALSKYKTTISAAPNFAFDFCAKKIKEEQLEGLDISNWSIALNGAEPVRAETIERFSNKMAKAGFRKKQFYPAYGMAESVVFLTGKNRNEDLSILSLNKEELGKNKVVFVDEHDEKSVKVVGLGFSWLDQELVVVNTDTLIPCKENEVGEIFISSPSITKEYWGNPEETERLLNKKLNSDDPRYKDRLFVKTEDLGFIHDGWLYITGRIKDLIIVNGHNYYPHHIEVTAENSHGAFRLGNCSAFAVDVDSQEKLVIIQEIKKDASNLDFNEMRHVIQKNVSEKHSISAYKILFVSADSLPKTSSGKLQRRLSKQMYLNNEFKYLG